MRNRKSVLAIVLIVIMAGVGLLIRQVAFAHETPALRLAAVSRGDIESVVSATGTLGAVTTVSVGTQVSGQVSELLVDYNDHVHKGQLLARIDPTLAQQAVTDAEANLAKVEAQASQAGRDQNRNEELASSGLIAKSALEQGGSALTVARADVRSAQVAVDRARQNLAYTNIYAPIDGVVVDRNVQEGQTVAASLSAPQLFLIANDLSKMQILAQVGESDVDQIQPGQAVSFTVQALPGQKFQGVVQQVRLQSTTTENVVNYTVVVNVDNPQQKLLPGMTARVDFLVQAAKNVLEVPNAALRFQPSADVIAELGAAQPKSSTSSGAATTTTAAKRTRSATAGTRPNVGTLYVLDANGKLQTIHVRLGISDGTVTAVQGKSLVEGMKVATGVVQAATAAPKAASNATPFQGQGQQQQGRRGSAAPGGF